MVILWRKKKRKTKRRIKKLLLKDHLLQLQTKARMLKKSQKKELKIPQLAQLEQKLIKEEVLLTKVGQYQKEQPIKENLPVNQEKIANLERIVLLEKTAIQDLKAKIKTKLPPELEAKLDLKAREKKKQREILNLITRKIIKLQEINRRRRRQNKQEDVKLLKTTPMLKKVQAEALLKNLMPKNQFPKARR